MLNFFLLSLSMLEKIGVEEPKILDLKFGVLWGDTWLAMKMMLAVMVTGRGEELEEAAKGYDDDEVAFGIEGGGGGSTVVAAYVVANGKNIFYFNILLYGSRCV